MTDNSEQGSADDARPEIERKLQPARDAERQEFINAFAAVPNLKRLAEEQLDNYLKWFKASEWRTVYSGGMITGPEPRGEHNRIGSSIERVLELTAKLESLQGFSGFGKLVSGLDNPSQISSTMFEVEVAAWCATRKAHNDISFSPPVEKRSGMKYPDFAWHATLGTLYCECKQLNTWQRKETHRANTLLSAVAQNMGDLELWPRGSRIEIQIRREFKGKSLERLKMIVARQAEEHTSELQS